MVGMLVAQMAAQMDTWSACMMAETLVVGMVYTKVVLLVGQSAVSWAFLKVDPKASLKEY